MTKKKAAALALFSGGLDSILACRVIAGQGIQVDAIRFVTPFFGYDLLRKEKAYVAETKEKFGINVTLQDISEKYLQMLMSPVHGYGKNFNPCLDCKILLATEIRKLLPQFNASFIISGEVLGQRPMSQRRDTMRIVERDSGCEGILLRPLCAKSMKPTIPELDGIVDREQLLDFSGRGRKDQMELAAWMGITEYPNPAGGCLLTDPNLGKRIQLYYEEHDDIVVDDLVLLCTGRQFRLPNGGMLAMGRNEKENETVRELAKPADRLLKMKDRPGPTGLLRYGDHPEDIKAAAGLVVRYGKKIAGAEQSTTVVVSSSQEQVEVHAAPLADELFRPWSR